MVNVNSKVFYVASYDNMRNVFSVPYRSGGIKEDMDMKCKLIRTWKNVVLYLTLPHFRVVLVIFLLSIVALVVAGTLQNSNPFLSSVFANVFAGLITGLVISLISAMKTMSLYKTECLIEWLNCLHEDILVYKEMHRKLIHFKNEEDIKEDGGALYAHIYDTLCRGNGINITISQGRFKKDLPFNPYEYFKKEFMYDAVVQIKENDKLHEKIVSLDVNNVTSKELYILFKEMDRQLLILNGEILKQITNLEVRKKMMNISPI